MSNKQIGQGAIGTGAGTLMYTCPTGYKCDIKDLMIANTTAGAINFSMYLVRSGGSPLTSNMFFPTIAIPANTSIQWEGVQSLNAGGFIQCIGSSSGITVTITGEETRT